MVASIRATPNLFTTQSVFRLERDNVTRLVVSLSLLKSPGSTVKRSLLCVQRAVSHLPHADGLNM